MTISGLTSTGTRNSFEYSDAKKGKLSGIWGITETMNLLTHPAALKEAVHVSQLAKDVAREGFDESPTLSSITGGFDELRTGI